MTCKINKKLCSVLHKIISKDCEIQVLGDWYIFLGKLKFQLISEDHEKMKRLSIVC